MEFIIKDLSVNVLDKGILKDFNLTINSGEIHAIMGPNGTGKSTLSKVIMGNKNYKVTSGDIIVDGKIVTSGDYSLIEKVDLEGYKWIEKDFGVSISKETNKKVILDTCSVKESVNNG